MFLTEDELVTLTGYKSPGKQAKWLTDRGLLYTRNGAGKVVLLRSMVEAMYGSPTAATPPEPRWDRLLEATTKKRKGPKE